MLIWDDNDLSTAARDEHTAGEVGHGRIAGTLPASGFCRTCGDILTPAHDCGGPLVHALRERDRARVAFEERFSTYTASGPYSRGRLGAGMIAAEEELNYWQGRVAFLTQTPR